MNITLEIVKRARVPVYPLGNSTSLPTNFRPRKVASWYSAFSSGVSEGIGVGWKYVDTFAGPSYSISHGRLCSMGSSGAGVRERWIGMMLRLWLRWERGARIGSNNRIERTIQVQ